MAGFIIIYGYYSYPPNITLFTFFFYLASFRRRITRGQWFHLTGSRRKWLLRCGCGQVRCSFFRVQQNSACRSQLQRAVGLTRLFSSKLLRAFTKDNSFALPDTAERILPFLFTLYINVSDHFYLQLYQAGATCISNIFMFYSYPRLFCVTSELQQGRCIATKHV